MRTPLLLLLLVGSTTAQSLTLTISSSNGDLTASVSGVPAGASAGLTLVSLATAGTVGGGPLWGITPDALTFTVLGTTPMPLPGNPFHWSVGPANSFPSVPYSLPPGTMTPFAGQTWDFVAIAYGLVVVEASNVERVTW